mmetsp:Transcript_49712/g.115312  ORF Transcript_49712/g.115312 Transcript_49712/m.115312 type:complete len:290 (+) Transcript_49712:282-1151(+)
MPGFLQRIARHEGVCVLHIRLLLLLPLLRVPLVQVLRTAKDGRVTHEDVLVYMMQGNLQLIHCHAVAPVLRVFLCKVDVGRAQRDTEEPCHEPRCRAELRVELPEPGCTSLHGPAEGLVDGLLHHPQPEVAPAVNASVDSSCEALCQIPLLKLAQGGDVNEVLATLWHILHRVQAADQLKDELERMQPTADGGSELHDEVQLQGEAERGQQEREGGRPEVNREGGNIEQYLQHAHHGPGARVHTIEPPRGKHRDDTEHGQNGEGVHSFAVGWTERLFEEEEHKEGKRHG